MPAAPSIVLPLTTWVIVQLLALGLSAAQVPLSAHFVRPPERAALEVMLCVQFATAALLFPSLLRSLGSSICVTALAWVYLLLAGFLATVPMTTQAWTGLHLTAWLAALAAWSSILSATPARSIGAAVAGFGILGTVVLLYVRMEYQPGASTALLDHTPLLAALRQAQNTDLRPGTFLPAGALLVTALVLRRIRPSRAAGLLGAATTGPTMPAP